MIWLRVPVSLPLASTGTTSRTSELLCGLVLTQILNILSQNDSQASNASNASGPLPSRHFLWHGSRSVTLDCSPWASTKLCEMVNSSLGKMSSIRIIFTLILKQSRMPRVFDASYRVPVVLNWCLMGTVSILQTNQNLRHWFALRLGY